MRINTNVNALLAWRNLAQTNLALAKSIERLSSGYRINRAADDAAGLAIASRMMVQVRGLRVAQRNAQDAISLVQTAEGALVEAEAILQKIHDLALEASNDSKTLADRLKIQDEINQLIDEIDRIAKTAEFNTKKLLDGSLSSLGRMATVANSTISSADVASVEAFSQAAIGTYTVTVETNGGVGLTVAQGTVLAGGTITFANTTKLIDANLGLQVGDVITIRGRVGGEEKQAALEVTGDTTLQQLYDTIKNTFGASVVDKADNDPTTPEYKDFTLVDQSLTANTFYIKGQAGRAFAITDVSITAAAQDGTARTAFNSTFSLAEKQAAGNLKDFLVKVDAPGGSSVVRAFTGGESLEVLSLKLVFGSNPADGGTASITVSPKDGRMTMQIGPNPGQSMQISIDDMSARALGLIDSSGRKLLVTTKGAANDALQKAKDALDKINNQRSKLGAFQNRLEHSIRNLSVAETNLAESHSRIRDADIALEMVEFTRQQILLQAGTAMLAQANVAPQTVLQLLGR